VAENSNDPPAKPMAFDGCPFKGVCPLSGKSHLVIPAGKDGFGAPEDIVCDWQGGLGTSETLH
jgi:hypothetical protein